MMLHHSMGRLVMTLMVCLPSGIAYNVRCLGSLKQQFIDIRAILSINSGPELLDESWPSGNLRVDFFAPGGCTSR